MIYRLRGILVEKDTEGVIVDVGGVGYRASASLSTLRALPSLGEACVTPTRMGGRGGGGYRASASLSPLRALPSLGEECVIHTRMVVREDAMLLFGFAAREERLAFDALTAVSKVGPKLALSVLSTMTPPEVSEAVARGDGTMVGSVPGPRKERC